MKEHNNIIKSHKKLYKSGKTWMVATLLTVGLAGGAAVTGTTNAHADEVTPAQATGTIQAGNQATDPELANAQSDAQKQQSTIDSANAQLKDQQNQLSEAQGQQSQAQQELDQAKQAQQAATQNDPAVKDAQAAVDQAQQQVNNQQQVVNDAQTVVNKDAQNVQQKSDAVNQASQAVDQAQQTVDQASQAVDQAKQAAVDATNQAASQKTEEAQNTINNLENQGKNQASQDLNNQINNVSGQVTDAQNDVNNTNAKIGDLQNQVKDLQNQEQNTQADPNIKTVPNGVIDYSKSLLENVSRNNLWSPRDMNANTNGNVVEQNIYVSPDNDKGNMSGANRNHDADVSSSAYDPYYTTDFDGVHGQMTDAQKQELAILLLNEINHAREQRGLKPFVMTEQKYQQAQVRASQHSAEVLDHNDNDIMTAFGQDQYENLAYISVDGGGNMLALFNNAGSTLSSMLNADASSDWGHRENFLEDTGSLSANAAFGFHLTDDGQSYVLTFDYDLSNPDSTPNMMDRIAQYQAMGPITGDAHTVDNSAKINDLNNQISNLQSTLASQQSHLSDLQTQLQNLQAQKANVQFDLSQLNADQQAEYNNAKNTLATINDWKNGQLANINSDGHVQDAINKRNQAKDSLKAEQSKLAQANQNLKNAEDMQTQADTNLQQAKDGLAQLNQVLATKQAALQTAKDNANASASQAVKDAQAKLDKINGKIADLNKAIAATKATISNAQAQLDKDNQKIANIKNGQKPSKPSEGSQPTTPTTPAKPSDGDKGTDTPAQPAKPSKGDDNKGDKPSEPTTPAKPDTGNKGSDTPVTPSKPTDGNKGTDTPVTPSKPTDNKGTDTPVTPTKPTDGNKGEQPTTPVTPAKPDTGNASISGQAGHKPDNTTVISGQAGHSQATTNKPTIVLPTNGKESGAATQGQYINIVSKDSVAAQAGIQAPAAPETTSVTFGTQEGTLMTREQYKAQQANLPQTGNENSKAVVALGVLAGMFGLGLAAKTKKEF
ncbi:SEC10/PgrA surface exclusion domain-containing protein [Limosilactobacillus reuteri]|uniref:SEC10/PgrA surface exclusion domain-containing protein n=1 Tax=Limosilactobacillus reuteri TaxID=1598 RepID=UPI001E61985A|nr:SEC10/PgrA surface exclusion domain-containing protein [Limosilactobacillus reuteri]MCC4489435.1 SEC10/PgrA surface exclusion domain-containing protein [Limosilactobacillus reuteri]MCC4493804.1 SEC10/PgrA surface exclusion domain-containing protein [Limosilactobacillus reuteri]MCC4496506.1 SEC10/PgrA surface exclusion domain-containing protein [Limosilactobacillus reuteri]